MGRDVSIAASHKSLEERLSCALRMKEQFGLELPMSVDTMADTFLDSYAAWPERFYIFHGGIVAYIAQPKHAAYCPAELRLWLSMYVREQQEKKKGPATAKASKSAGRRSVAPDMEMVFGEAAENMHDLISEYQQYIDRTSMLSEFDSDDSEFNRSDEESEEDSPAPPNGD
eukprot:gnl/TRDRNA2_/TRDRNA2_204664_c0_seq1.p1 gnl/TRDRNA2_/TRDRNA2_204664_c0~~gnl/TRDRNA2_/TRDRNA2_204664_c0_seq1.p1  ORF type:complete len:198 (+),score=38.09 gnl/TRDRNA2_/TRDRNA2_204664_c0_seq1:84-596(+)